MVSPNSLLEAKKWTPWEHIHWAKDKDVEDHPWYNLWEPALQVPPAPTTTEVMQVKGTEKERNEDMDSGKLGEHATFIITIDFCSEECQVQVYSSRGSGQGQMGVDKGRGQRAGQEISLVGDGDCLDSTTRVLSIDPLRRFRSR